MTPYGADEPNKARGRDYRKDARHGGADDLLHEHCHEYAKALRHRARQAASDVIAAELDMMAESEGMDRQNEMERRFGYSDAEWDRMVYGDCSTRERVAPVRGGQWLTTRDDGEGPAESRAAATCACCGSLNACITG